MNLGAPGNYVIPLSAVSRLEEFDVSQVQYSGEQRVITYRDSLLPLLDLRGLLELPSNNQGVEQAKISVVVVRRGNRSYGFEVKSILDIVTADTEVNARFSDRKGVLGTLTKDKDVMVVLDVFSVISAYAAKHDFSGSDDEKLKHGMRQKHKVLVADDSSFFRSQLRQLLTDSGYQVEVVQDGQEAFKVLSAAQSSTYALLLSDIEMPNMTGIELARKLRGRDQTKTLPLVALSTRAGAADIDLGMKAGFTKYLEKMVPEQVIQTIDGLLGVA